MPLMQRPAENGLGGCVRLHFKKSEKTLDGFLPIIFRRLRLTTFSSVPRFFFSRMLTGGVRASGFWLVVFLFVIAGYLAWRDERQRANEEHQKVIALEQRMQSRIRVSCGSSVHQSVVTELDGRTTWFRAKLELIGHIPVPDIEAHVIELLEDARKVGLQECLILTMYPGKTSPEDKNLRTLYAGTPEFVDIIHVTHDGRAVFPIKFYNRSMPYETLLQPNRTYTILITLTTPSPSHPTITCTFEFDWTDEPNSSDIRLIGVTPPSSTPDAAVSQPLPVSAACLG